MDDVGFWVVWAQEGPCGVFKGCDEKRISSYCECG